MPVSPPTIDRTLGAYLAYQGVSQFACSETQKFGHVTYFGMGTAVGISMESYETYVEIPDDLVPFEQRPWMKAAEIVDATLDELRSKTIRYGRINIANGDMVGHAGDLHAAVAAMTVTDLALGRLLQELVFGGVAFDHDDHGNCEEMYERNKRRANL